MPLIVKRKLSLFQKSDVQRIAEEAENILRCSIFKLLEKVIEQECKTGQLDFSSISQPILDELKLIKIYLEKCDKSGDGDTHIDEIIQNQIIKIMDKHLEITLSIHHASFHKLTAELDLSSEFSFAYNAFVNVCKKLMSDEITWYRVVALLCFGAEVAVAVIKKSGPGVQSFIDKIVHYVVDFILKEEVADWIYNHGGWVTMINFFDSEHCPKRADHLISIMALSEYTVFEMWLRRIAISTIVVGTFWLFGKAYMKN